MFIDKVEIFVKAGKGGDGCVSFHREKFVAKGGPDGGDGGRGGSVIFVVDKGQSTLNAFKNRRRFIALDGAAGANSKFSGKSADDLIITVPQGTLIRDASSFAVMADMSNCDRFVCAKGGRGGWGNTHFATPTRQAPRFAKKGTDGEEKRIILELKMIADVGFVGLPNAGKSTLLSIISAARPKIASYRFTTLTPNLGVVSCAGGSFVAADIPGLIEGAAEGAGLGLDFLRHIDRCRLLVHLFDISGFDGDPLENIKKINSELSSYGGSLQNKPQILVANKTDLPYSNDDLEKIREYAKEHSLGLYLISGATHSGVDKLVGAIASELSKLPPVVIYEPEYVQEDSSSSGTEVKVTHSDGVWYVYGEWLKKLCDRIDFEDFESLSFFQQVLKKNGVIKALEDSGIDEGNTVNIYGLEFDFLF